MSHKFEEKASNSGAKQLGNPIEETSQDSYMAPNSQSNGDSWIQMSTWYVNANPCATATPTKPAGSRAASDVILSIKSPKRKM